MIRGAGLLCVRFLQSWRQHRPSSRSAPVEALTSGQVRAAGDVPTTDGVDRSEHARPCCIEHRARPGARVSDPVLPRAFRRRQYRPAFRERSTTAFRKPSRFEHPSLRRDLGQSLFVAGNDDRIVAPQSKFGCGKMPSLTTTTCEPVHVPLAQMVLTSSRYPGERRELMAIERYRLPVFK